MVIPIHLYNVFHFASNLQTLRLEIAHCSQPTAHFYQPPRCVIIYILSVLGSKMRVSGLCVNANARTLHAALQEKAPF